ncbi:MAG TPA: bifunctional phosphoserine phosphatase/homoserine phosphotransferase ThrH [bacterium]|nr:bifunctional phosphoserine phosphatase/homoserine phosphotransferase ThrH [bacterium]
MDQPLLVALDLESVLVPEFWPAIAAATGVGALQRTTRDEPAYDRLMAERLAVLRDHRLSLRTVQAILAALAPLPGAPAFLDWLRDRATVVILSDTFYEFAAPLMMHLGRPALLCHTIVVDADGMITGWRQRCPDGKAAAVRAFRNLGFTTAAVADSHNDLGMLHAADCGFFFRPPAALAAAHPGYPVCTSYAELQQRLTGLIST